MLVFVYVLGHDLKIPFLLYLLHKRRVYSQITKGCTVLITGGCSGAGEIVVV